MESKALSSHSRENSVDPPQKDDQSIVLLKSILTKTQLLLKTTQTALETERSVHQNQLQTQENRLLTHLSSYRDENRLLRSELEKLESGGKSTEFSLRKTFFSKLETLELDAKRKEGELKGQIEFLTEEMEAARTELEEKRRIQTQEKRDLKTELTLSKRENAYLGGQLEKSLGSLKTKVQKTTQQLIQRADQAKKDKNAYIQKLNLLLKHSNESEDLWLREKQYQVSNLSIASKIQTEKEANFASQFSLIQLEKERTISEYRETVDLLRKEKEASSSAFQETFQSCTDREIALEKEIVRLENALVKVISINQIREGKLYKDLGMLGNEFKSMQETRELDQGFNAEFSLALEKYRVLISDFHRENDDLVRKNEVLGLKQSLENKENELISMRDMYVTARQGEKTRISKAVANLKSVSEEFQRNQGKMIVEGLTVLETLRKNVDLSVDNLSEVAETYRSAGFQLKKSRSEVRKLKTDLKRMELELVQAQKVIGTHMDTIQQYEQALFLSDEKSNGQKDGFETQVQALQRELDLLREAKVNQTRVFSKEIEEMRNTMSEKEGKLEEISLELVKLKALKSAEGSKLLHQKFDSLLKLGQTLESALTAMNLGSKQIEEMNHFLCESEVQELHQLRSLAKDSEETYKNLKESWSREKTALESEISAVKIDFSTKESRLLGVVKEQHNLLEIQNQRIRDLELGQMSTGPEVQIRTESSTPELTKTFKTEAEALRIQLENAGNSHFQELEILKSRYEKEAISNKLLMDSLSTDLRNKTTSLNHLSIALRKEKDLHEKETQMMREEVKKLRSHCYERYELLQNERKDVISELKTLLEVAGEKEVNDRKAFYLAIKKMKTLLDVSGPDHRGGNKLQQLEEELTALKSVEEERDKQRSKERDSFKAMISNLNDSIAFLTRSAETEKEDHRLETRVLQGKIEELENECRLLREERDDWLLQREKEDKDV